MIRIEIPLISYFHIFIFFYRSTIFYIASCTLYCRLLHTQNTKNLVDLEKSVI